MKILFACITNLLLDILHLKGIKVSKIVKRDPALSNSNSSKNNKKIMPSYSKQLVLKYLNPSIILLTGSSEEPSGLGGQAGPVCPVHCISTVMLSSLAAATSSRYSSFSLQTKLTFHQHMTFSTAFNNVVVLEQEILNKQRNLRNNFKRF